MLAKAEYEEAALFFESHFDTHNKTARICYARAIGLGGQPQKALILIDQLDEDYPNDTEVLLNQAEANLWVKQPRESIVIYDKLLHTDPQNFVANLGYANAHAELQEIDTALVYITKARVIDPDNLSARTSEKFILLAKAYRLFKSSEYDAALDLLEEVRAIEPDNASAKEMIQLIKEDRRTEVELTCQESSDLEDNRAQTKRAKVSYSLTDKVRISFLGEGRDVQDKLGREAQQQRVLISSLVKLSDKYHLTVGGGLNSNKTESGQFKRGVLLAGMEMYLSEKLYAKVHYNNELHNYGVGLIESNILMNHFSVASNYMLFPKLGIYGNGVYTTQSDSNQRLLGFGSLYYSLTNKPLVRFGVNYQHFGFTGVSANYFSPDTYQLGEAFFMLGNAESADKLKFKLEVGFGSQRINKRDSQSTARVLAMASYEFLPNTELQLIYNTNSAATANAIGAFSFNLWSITLRSSF